MLYTRFTQRFGLAINSSKKGMPNCRFRNPMDAPIDCLTSHFAMMQSFLP